MGMIAWYQLRINNTMSVEDEFSWSLIPSSVYKQSTSDTNAVFENNLQQTPGVITYQYGGKFQDWLKIYGELHRVYMDK